MHDKQGELSACATLHPCSLQAEVEHAAAQLHKGLVPLQIAGASA
jgi:hypothetical protein